MDSEFDKITTDLLQSIASENGLMCYEIRKNDKSVKVDGFHGIVLGVQLMCKNKESNKETINVVVKSALKSDALRDYVIINDMYTREVYMYNAVFAVFNQFETDKNLVPTSLAPKFYKANLEDKNEILVLENLKESGYKMYSPKKAMDAKHVSLVLEKLSLLHALGFALRDQNLEKFKEIKSLMDDVFMKFVEKANYNYIEGAKRISLKALQSLREDVDGEAYKVYKDHINSVEKIFDVIKNDVSDDFSTVLHGDAWSTNIMFKYDNSNDPNSPTSVRFIDFQLARLGSPVLDVALFFYSCTEKELIMKLEDYLRVYYNSLTAHLIKLGSNPDKVYPYSVFSQQWRKYARFGLSLATINLFLTLVEKNEAAEVADLAEADKSLSESFNYDIANSNVFYERVRQIILHFVENKLI